MNNSLGDRIRIIRKDNQLTQTAFGEILHIKGNTVTGYETGIRIPPDSIIANICEKFDVCEAWLRTGQDPKHPPRTRQQEIARMMGQAMAEGDPDRLSILSLALSLTPAQIAALKDLALQLAADFQKTEKEPES